MIEKDKLVTKRQQGRSRLTVKREDERIIQRKDDYARWRAIQNNSSFACKALRGVILSDVRVNKADLCGTNLVCCYQKTKEPFTTLEVYRTNQLQSGPKLSRLFPLTVPFSCDCSEQHVAIYPAQEWSAPIMSQIEVYSHGRKNPLFNYRITSDKGPFPSWITLRMHHHTLAALTYTESFGLQLWMGNVYLHTWTGPISLSISHPFTQATLMVNERFAIVQIPDKPPFIFDSFQPISKHRIMRPDVAVKGFLGMCHALVETNDRRYQRIALPDCSPCPFSNTLSSTEMSISTGFNKSNIVGIHPAITHYSHTKSLHHTLNLCTLTNNNLRWVFNFPYLLKSDQSIRLPLTVSPSAPPLAINLWGDHLYILHQQGTDLILDAIKFSVISRATTTAVVSTKSRAKSRCTIQ